jgi:hypothetical protein
VQPRHGGADWIIGAGRESREPAVGDLEVKVEQVLRVGMFPEVGPRVEGYRWMSIQLSGEKVTYRIPSSMSRLSTMGG